MKEFWLAPFVIALRMPVLAREAHHMATGRMPLGKRAESERMVTEKIVALNEGMLLACIEITRVQLELGFLAVTGNSTGFLRVAQAVPRRIAAAAAGPGGKRVRSNMTRLAAR